MDMCVVTWSVRLMCVEKGRENGQWASIRHFSIIFRFALPVEFCISLYEQLVQWHLKRDTAKCPLAHAIAVTSLAWEGDEDTSMMMMPRPISRIMSSGGMDLLTSLMDIGPTTGLHSTQEETGSRRLLFITFSPDWIFFSPSNTELRPMREDSVFPNATTITPQSHHPGLCGELIVRQGIVRRSTRITYNVCFLEWFPPPSHSSLLLISPDPVYLTHGVIPWWWCVSPLESHEFLAFGRSTHDFVPSTVQRNPSNVTRTHTERHRKERRCDSVIPGRLHLLRTIPRRYWSSAKIPSGVVHCIRGNETIEMPQNGNEERQLFAGESACTRPRMKGTRERACYWLPDTMHRTRGH